jgi:hypothetical protein
MNPLQYESDRKETTTMRPQDDELTGIYAPSRTMERALLRGMIEASTIADDFQDSLAMKDSRIAFLETQVVHQNRKLAELKGAADCSEIAFNQWKETTCGLYELLRHIEIGNLSIVQAIHLAMNEIGPLEEMPEYDELAKGMTSAISRYRIECGLDKPADDGKI